MDATLPQYGYANLPPAEPGRRWPFDPRLLGVTLAVIGFVGLGLLSAAGFIPMFGVSFSAKVSQTYVPLAAVLILLIGWTPRGYAVAAGVFYGFLPLAQAAHVNYFLLGDVQAALTFDMVLALPLIIVGLLGPPGGEPGRNRALPAALRFGWPAVILCSVISSILGLAPEIAIVNSFSRIILPSIVTLVTFRRLRGIRDYQVVWLGFMVGITIIGVHNLRQGVFGYTAWYSAEASQRFAAGSGSWGIATMYAAGPALWVGHALAVRRSLLLGIPALLLVSALGVLLWLGAHRGPVIFFGLLILWWVPGHVLRYLMHGRGFVFTVLGSFAVAGLVAFLIRRTAFDLRYILERFDDMLHYGVGGEPRWVLWFESLDHWSSSPIWGLGPNTWTLVNTRFESMHSSLFGILFDLGLLGLICYGLLFGGTVAIARKSHLGRLRHLDLEFYLGCRAGWGVTAAMLMVNLSFTCGQPYNNILAYLVLMFPLLAMTVYARHGPMQPVPLVAPFTGPLPVPPSASAPQPAPPSRP